jgi:hypothetical protein
MVVLSLRVTVETRRHYGSGAHRSMGGYSERLRPILGNKCTVEATLPSPLLPLSPQEARDHTVTKQHHAVLTQLGRVNLEPGRVCACERSSRTR